MELNLESVSELEVEKLIKFLSNPSDLSNLQEVNMRRKRVLYIGRGNKKGQSYHELQHVPNVEFVTIDIDHRCEPSFVINLDDPTILEKVIKAVPSQFHEIVFDRCVLKFFKSITNDNNALAFFDNLSKLLVSGGKMCFTHPNESNAIGISMEEENPVYHFNRYVLPFRFLNDADEWGRISAKHNSRILSVLEESNLFASVRMIQKDTEVYPYHDTTELCDHVMYKLIAK
jgi:hypothetical protein